MWQLLGILRLFGLGLVVTVGLFISLFSGMMSYSVFSAIARRWYRCVVYCLGLRCNYQGASIEQTVLVVSNHISWADVIVIGARWPFVFLSMHAVSSWPVVGWLARRAGTLFIERGQGAPGAIRQVSEVLGLTRSVVLFPEGRTSPGVRVSKFHPRIFQAAVDAGVPVQPLGIAYHDKGQHKSLGSRISYANGGFFDGVWRTICGPQITAEVQVFEPVLPPHHDRQQLAKTAESKVAGHVAFTLNSCE